jgi:hypothetical protein
MLAQKVLISAMSKVSGLYFSIQAMTLRVL